MNAIGSSPSGSPLQRHGATLLWLLLMTATGMSIVASEADHLPARVATAVVMLVAYGKSRLLLLHFMRVGDAPIGWRIFFELWLIAIVGEILIYAVKS